MGEEKEEEEEVRRVAELKGKVDGSRKRGGW